MLHPHAENPGPARRQARPVPCPDEGRAGADPVAVAPKAASAAARPSPSPAKSLPSSVAGAFTTNAAAKGHALAAADNWEEF